MVTIKVSKTNQPSPQNSQNQKAAILMTNSHMKKYVKALSTRWNT